MIDVRLLGSTELTRDGASVGSVLVQPKRLAILVFLLLAHPGGFTRRDQLLTVFWPESDQARARNALRQALHKLRKSLGPDVVVVRGEDEVGIAWERVRVDALDLERAVEAGDGGAILELFRGPLLEGFHLGSTPTFGEWLDGERRRLEHRTCNALVRYARECESQGDLDAGLEAARKASELRPTDEPAVRCLIGMLDRSGDHAGALARLLRLERDVETEFGATVAPETARLGRRLREGAEARLDRSPAPSVDASPAGGASAIARPTGSAANVEGPRLRRLAPYLVGVVVALGIILGVTRHSSIPAAAERPPAPEVVLADAAGLDRDDRIQALHLWLRLELQAGPAVTTVSRARVRGALRRMGRAPNTELTVDVAMELARRNGFEVVVAPSFSVLNDEWLLAAEIHVPGRADPLTVDPEPVSEAEGLHGAVERLADRVRGRLGEVSVAIPAGLPLPEVTTTNFEAIRAYAMAERARQRTIWIEASRHLQRAVELDSLFASAWALLGRVHVTAGLPDEGGVALRRAYALRDRLPAHERPEVEFLFHFFAEGDVEAARGASNLLRESYPERRSTWLEQQMLLAAATADWASGALHARALLAADTDLDAAAWWLIVGHLQAAGEEDAAQRALDRWEEEDGPASDVIGARLRIAWVRGDWREALRLLDTEEGRRLAGPWERLHRSNLAVERGRLEESAAHFEEWLHLHGAELDGFLAGPLAWRALVDLHVLGDTARARSRIAGLSGVPVPRRPTVARVQVALGEPEAAARTLAGIDPDSRVGDGHRSRQEYYAARSGIELARGRIDEAIRLGRIAVASAAGGRTDCAPCGALALARALDAGERRAEAIRWYEYVVDWDWVISPYRNMSAAYQMPVRARLALLYAGEGRLAEAREQNLEIIRAWDQGDAGARRWTRAAAARLAELDPD